MSNRLMGAIVLVALLALVGCGQGSKEKATLEIASVPAAEIYVDGESRGTSPATLSLTAGEHRLELRTDKFASFETAVTLTAGESKPIDAALAPLDPSDPVVIAKLAQAHGVDVPAFEAPQVTRGRAGSRAAAILLWPSKDVRKAGLINYAIEADETYEGDGTLEFRHGRKVLYRESFTPETITTVRAMPAAVLERVKVGTKITWGIYYEDRRKPVKTTFRVVNRLKADRQLAKLESSRHMARQPEITKACMRATILENNRLYTEALVKNLEIAASYPESTQPYRGIVTTLRRLDGKRSELWAFVTPHVGGKGGHAGGGISARSQASSTGITAWLPKSDPTFESPAAGEQGATTEPMTPGNAGVAPPEQDLTSKDETTPAEPGETVPTERVDEAAVAEMQKQITDMERQASDLATQAQNASTQAAESQQAAEAAEQSAQEAEAAASAAREAVEQAAEPTREQQEEMAKTGAAAEEAREAADKARQAAATAQEQADRAEHAAQEHAQNVAEMKRALDAARGIAPDAERDTTPAAPDAETLGRNYEAAKQTAETAKTAWDDAKKQLEAAEAAHQANPTENTASALADAHRAVERAARDAYDTQEELEAARKAVEGIGDQVQEPGPK